MFLYLKEYGYKVSKRGDYLVVEHHDGKVENYSLDVLDSVYLAGECRVSKSTLEALADMDIHTVLLSRKGSPVFYVLPTGMKPKMVRFWERQSGLSEYKKKFLLRHFVINSIASKASVISRISKSRSRYNKDVSRDLYKYAKRINGILRKSREVKSKNNKFGDLRRTLMGLEGFSARLYFEALSHVVPEAFGYFGLRTRRPPRDLFNAAISFGYAYLKYIVERSLILRGINPYHGVLHFEEDKVAPFLTFDFMEGFRHTFVDRSVLNLIARRSLKPQKHASASKGGVYINKRGVGILYRELSKNLKHTGKELNREISYFMKVVSS